MPCVGGLSYEQEMYDERKSLVEKAALCAALKFIESAGSYERFLATFNECGQGVSVHEVNVWWKEHKKEDADRLHREEKAARLKVEKEEALAKLTNRERKLLGLR